MTPLKAIRAKCLDCMCGQANEVKLCPCDDCSLYTFRLGRNANIKREYTEEQIASMRKRAEQARIAKNLNTTVKKNDLSAPGVYKDIPDSVNAENTPET